MPNCQLQGQKVQICRADIIHASMPACDSAQTLPVSEPGHCTGWICALCRSRKALRAAAHETKPFRWTKLECMADTMLASAPSHTGKVHSHTLHSFGAGACMLLHPDRAKEHGSSSPDSELPAMHVVLRALHNPCCFCLGSAQCTDAKFERL